MQTPRVTNQWASASLEKWTNELSDELGGKWGPARKALNLFLRDSLYNFWLRQAYHLEEIENDFEVPLDGKVMTEIRNESNVCLPKVWVKNLTPSISDRYQANAELIARGKGIFRVHLDIEWWSSQPE